jgi:hypothetical protein
VTTKEKKRLTVIESESENELSLIKIDTGHEYQVKGKAPT